MTERPAPSEAEALVERLRAFQRSRGGFADVGTRQEWIAWTNDPLPLLREAASLIERQAQQVDWYVEHAAIGGTPTQAAALDEHFAELERNPPDPAVQAANRERLREAAKMFRGPQDDENAALRSRLDLAMRVVRDALQNHYDGLREEQPTTVGVRHCTHGETDDWPDNKWIPQAKKLLALDAGTTPE